MIKDVNKKNIVIIGNTNSGKSTIFNHLINQDKSIVSKKAGTTTDPVLKIIEIIGIGGVNLLDTAGLDDFSDLGRERVKKTLKKIEDSSLVLYVVSAEELLKNNLKSTLEIDDYFSSIKSIDYLKDKKILFIISKIDLLNFNLDKKYLQFSNINFSIYLDNIFSKISKNLEKEDEINLVEGLLESNSLCLLVIPIDSEAPKGRLILPQVQMLRALCDKNITSIISSFENLESNLKKYNPDLVITDSKIFKDVASVVPRDIRLTSFSILFARQKGDINIFYEGAKKIDTLKKGDKILIAESCTHTKNHEDIGNVLIPRLIKNKTGISFDYTFSNGEMPDDISKFSLIIQCGGCMLNKLNMEKRMKKALDKNIPITNYGILISYLSGELERATFWKVAFLFSIFNTNISKL